jgi:hypothetical protein
MQILLIALVSLLIPSMAAAIDCRDGFLISSRGLPAENAKYAKQMGYDCIGYQPGMEDVSDAAGMRFFLAGSANRIDTPPSDPSVLNFAQINTALTYTQAEKDWRNSVFAWKNTDAFPYNLATGWFNTATRYNIIPDFQQQVVIDLSVNTMMNMAANLERPAMDFRFGGFHWDVPQLTGDFWSGVQSGGGQQVTLSYWTGQDSSILHSGITHQYSTYSDAVASLYKSLFTRMVAQFPQAMLVMEPWGIYENWISVIKNRSDFAQLMPSNMMLCDEMSGTVFVDDSRIFASGRVTKDRVCISEPNSFGEYENRLYMAKAAINGAWFNWFLRFGGTGDMPNYNHVYEVPHRLLLIRRLPAWDNQMNVPLSSRSWDGTTYHSPNSHADGHVIYSRHAKTGKLFVVFLDSSGTVTLRDGESVTSVQRADGYFMESGDGIADVSIVGTAITLSNLAYLGEGYILTTPPTPLPRY